MREIGRISEGLKKKRREMEENKKSIQGLLASKWEVECYIV